ncbi:hypothetical protein [Streptomyces sp. NPDC048411]|uniref:hypothetical protein n=1 Tax=Streptomyces sp. NPDC048411 TaxID=3157206 RepID=UPI0034550F31
MSRPTGWHRGRRPGRGVSPPGGALVADSVQIPGELLGLMSIGARTERVPVGHP